MATTALTIPSSVMLQLIERELARDPEIKSAHSRRGYLADLKKFETDFRAGRPLTKLLINEYAALLQRKGRSGSTINRVLASLRWWSRRWAELVIEDASIERPIRDEMVLQAERVASVKDVDDNSLPAGRHIEASELAALMRACMEDPTPAGVRDAAIFALASASGARRAEITSAWTGDYRQINAATSELTLRGKGDKPRGIYLSRGAAWALADWLKLRGSFEGFIFCPIAKGGRIDIDHGLSTNGLAKMLEKRRRQALVDPLTWHDFRRTFAGNLLDAGEDIATVQKLMGHASPVTTSNYDRRPEEVRRQALGKLHVPYTQRALLPARKVKK